MKEVQIIKASKDKVIRSGATIENKIRVAPYARVSTETEEQKNSYESQKKYYQELVSNNPEWELVDIYADEAISGTQVYKRTDFMRMINDAMEGKIENAILESKMSELTKEKSKLENELNKLIEQKNSKENYNNRINDIKNKLNTLNRLESFDRQVFEYMISKIIIGKSDDNEEQYSLHITFVLTTDDEISGYTNSTNKKKSLNNARLDIERDTCGDCCFVTK